MPQCWQRIARAAEHVGVNFNVPSSVTAQLANGIAAPFVDLERQQSARLQQRRRARE